MNNMTTASTQWMNRPDRKHGIIISDESSDFVFYRIWQPTTEISASHLPVESGQGTRLSLRVPYHDVPEFHGGKLTRAWTASQTQNASGPARSHPKPGSATPTTSAAQTLSQPTYRKTIY